MLGLKALSALHLRTRYFNDCTQVFNNRVSRRMLRGLFFVFYRETGNMDFLLIFIPHGTAKSSSQIDALRFV